LTHGEYNFYNPTQHRFFDQESGRLIYFEGTYTDSFSGARVQTPRYDYNQIMYRLALDDARLRLPVAIYRVRNPDGRLKLMLRNQVDASSAWARVEKVAWFALPSSSQGPDCVPLYAKDAEQTALTLARPRSDATALCSGFPLVDNAGPPPSPSERHSPALVVLQEYRRADNGGLEYSTDAQPPPRCLPDGRPLCRVWRVPGSVLTLDWQAKPRM
jgi:hypothetical protein